MEEEQHKSMDQSEEKAGMDGENEGSFKRWREEIERMKEIREGGLIDQIQEHHMNVRGFERKLYAGQKFVAMLVAATLLLGVLVNEFCSGWDYVAYQLSPEQILSRKHAGGCQHGPAEPLKIVLSVLTVILLSFVVYHWQCKAKILSEMRQLRQCYLMPNDERLVRKTSGFLIFQLLVELTICAIHPLPFVHAVWEFDLDHDGWDIGAIYYRFESIMVALMFLRLYLLWRWFRLLCYHKFLHLDDSFAMEDFSALDLMQLSGNVSPQFFHLKVMVSKYPVRVISSMVTVAYLSICYLIRITEGPAYQPHSADWWDQMWITITQGTTGYGGTVPVTQWGRFCSVLMMLLGPMTVSFMTATMTKNVTLTGTESSLLRLMQGNTLKVRVMQTAAKMLQHWWRTHKRAKDQTAVRKKRKSVIEHLKARNAARAGFGTKGKLKPNGAYGNMASYSRSIAQMAARVGASPHTSFQFEQQYQQHHRRMSAPDWAFDSRRGSFSSTRARSEALASPGGSMASIRGVSVGLGVRAPPLPPSAGPGRVASAPNRQDAVNRRVAGNRSAQVPGAAASVLREQSEAAPAGERVAGGRFGGEWESGVGAEEVGGLQTEEGVIHMDQGADNALLASAPGPDTDPGAPGPDAPQPPPTKTVRTPDEPASAHAADAKAGEKGGKPAEKEAKRRLSEGGVTKETTPGLLDHRNPSLTAGIKPLKRATSLQDAPVSGGKAAKAAGLSRVRSLPTANTLTTGQMSRYAKTKSLLLYRNFLAALADYDRFLLQTTQNFDGDGNPFLRRTVSRGGVGGIGLGAGLDSGGGPSKDQDGTGIAKLQADVSSIQSEVKSLGQSMLQMAQSMQEIKALLGQQNPPDRARAVGQFMPLPTMVEGQQMQSDELLQSLNLPAPPIRPASAQGI